jgi:hypothetical protein
MFWLVPEFNRVSYLMMPHSFQLNFQGFPRKGIIYCYIEDYCLASEAFQSQLNVEWAVFQLYY